MSHGEHAYESGVCSQCGHVSLHNCANGEACTICGASVERMQLTLPADLDAVADEAFLGTAEEAILVPEGCTAICEKAFASSDTLTAVIFTAKDAEIAANALEGSENAVVIAPAGGTVELWANENGVPFIPAQ